MTVQTNEILKKYLGKKVSVKRFATDIAKNPLLGMDFESSLYATVGKVTAITEDFIELDGNMVISLKWVYSISWTE